MRHVELQLPAAAVTVQMCLDQGLPENLQFCVSGSSAFFEIVILISCLILILNKDRREQNFLQEGCDGF